WRRCLGRGRGLVRVAAPEAARGDAPHLRDAWDTYPDTARQSRRSRLSSSFPRWSPTLLRMRKTWRRQAHEHSGHDEHQIDVERVAVRCGPQRGHELEVSPRRGDAGYHKQQRSSDRDWREIANE